MTAPTPGQREGWGWPGAATKPHYFVGTESLCGQWLFGGHLGPHTGPTSKKDCVRCVRALSKRLAGPPAVQP